MERYFFLFVFPWLSAAVLPLYLCLLHSIWRSDSSHLEIHGAAADSTACCWYQRKHKVAFSFSPLNILKLVSVPVVNASSSPSYISSRHPVKTTWTSQTKMRPTARQRGRTTALPSVWRLQLSAAIRVWWSLLIGWLGANRLWRLPGTEPPICTMWRRQSWSTHSLVGRRKYWNMKYCVYYKNVEPTLRKICLSISLKLTWRHFISWVELTQLLWRVFGYIVRFG